MTHEDRGARPSFPPSFIPSFIGRDSEMQRLRAALQDALCGRGRIVMLVGEPGIGKTRTAEQLAGIARGVEGLKVLWGSCFDGESAVPYWPWLQVFNGYLKGCNEEELRAQLGRDASVASEVLAAIRERLTEVQPPPRIEDAEAARARLLGALAAFLVAAAERQPLLVVLEDLNWSDTQSLLLLEHLAHQMRQARLMILGTYRDVELGRHHPLARSLGELARHGCFERVPLRGLGRDAVSGLLAAAFGGPVGEGFLQAFYERTEGNPFFVVETARLLGEEGSAGDGNAVAPGVKIPEGVREAVGRRLDRLSGECNEVLRCASVIGREFDLRGLGCLPAGRDEGKVLEGLEEAGRAGLVEELSGGFGRYRFSHALIRETLSGELSLARRVRMHAELARELERQYGAEADAHAEEPARHFGEAEPLVGPEKGGHYALVAGDRAMERHAYEEALAYYRRVVEARRDRPMDRETADMLLRGSWAQFSTWAKTDALAGLKRAFEYYVQAGDRERAIETAYMTSIAALLATIQGRAAPTYPDGLTEREVVVLRLAAQGKTNKEIGYALYISIKTVATHLQHIFEKTHSANRAEATAYAVRHGLAREDKAKG